MRGQPDPRRVRSQLRSVAERLSKREIDVLRLLAVGYSNLEIAQALVITESTVKMHLKHLYGKLDVHNRLQAVVQAQALQLIE
ncbi:MAG TPA: helix-turn-helix transcriptional regulator [Roseiflexaceae bacterium]|nr:helix-turn-helix transcriptional regulator [Roseiflexaceae bacterium]